MTTDVERMDEARDAFEKWTSKYDHYSNEYLNMGADAYFVAGYQAALESASIAALIAELRAWRERFQAYVYRPQDDCVANRFWLERRQPTEEPK